MDAKETAHEGEAAYLAGLLAEALRAHRADMHNTSSRPCATCAQSARALSAYDRWRRTNPLGPEDTPPVA